MNDPMDASDPPCLDVLNQVLVDHALPDQIKDFSKEDRIEAAAFVAATAQHRAEGAAVIRLESVGGEVGRRQMRLCIVNDDMPFLVDSIVAAIAAKDLIIHRLLHPVIEAERNADGDLLSVEPVRTAAQCRESIIYIEVDRLGASARRDLIAELHDILDDVRASVRDWDKLRAKMHEDADQLADSERTALLHWFANGALTLLGYQVHRPGQPPSDSLGLLSTSGQPIWGEHGTPLLIRYFEQGGDVPLVAKADHLSTVHRRVPLDIIILPLSKDERITGVGVHAGVWSSKALTAPAGEVPVLRRRLGRFEQEFGFDPRGHTGKALRDTIESLPRDLLVSLGVDEVKQLTLTAMSLADRPRPTLVLLRSIVKSRLFAFVWLPREELSTRRRLAIGEKLATAAEGRISSWSVEPGPGNFSLIRYTLNLSPGTPSPDVEALDDWLHELVRGWKPGVEDALRALVGAGRATRLALNHVDDFPESYRSRTDPAEAAQDVLRLCDLGADDRNTRLYRERGDETSQLHLKTYRLGGVIPLSDAVPVFENFGFRVIEEQPTLLEGRKLGHIHDFALEVSGGGDAGEVMQRAGRIERAIAAVLENKAEDDAFNQLIVGVGLESGDVMLLRAWFRYLRQTSVAYSLTTVVEALRRAPGVARGLLELFHAQHDPAREGSREEDVIAADRAISDGLAQVSAIDEDRILRLFRAVIDATMRTNAFAEGGKSALAFKLDSSVVPNLPAPVPWREIWIYSPRVEGIHLRGGPVARGGLRWSDRRDDFRTEVLGLMKAQVVKNAVIIPTGAKGGFYPKQLPPAGDREAWLREGTESYRIFIRALLSVTDSIVQDIVVHPQGVTMRDGDDPYFVVAADKGTASFSDVANAIALERGFWLGDAFASGGSNGYDHKAMGITAKGAWISVQRHFLELGVDVQREPIHVVGCGDMSGDVFGNGMLLSKAIKLVAAFDHRHIFIDPTPDPAVSWDERNRLFSLPRSSWDDYDKSLISAGGGVFPRTQKSIPLTPEIRAVLDLETETIDPSGLIGAILRAPVDLIWFGGIGTYIKARSENHIEVGDPGNDVLRVNAAELRAKAIGEGANLAITQAGRIEFALRGGRINTDFIDNSAGVDCSDNEVNIKIPLNREMAEGRLSQEDRNQLLADMTTAVSDIVLEDNRLQTLALSIAERRGAAALPPLIRALEILEESGRLNREVEGLESNEELLRRAQDNRGLTRPELAVLLSTTKLALQDAIEASALTQDPSLDHELCEAFPKQMQERHADAILQHRLRRQIIATKIANRLVNRLGIVAPFSLIEEEGASLSQAAAAFVAAEQLFGMDALWRDLDTLAAPEEVRLELFDQASNGLQLDIAGILRSTSPAAKLGEMVENLAAGLAALNGVQDDLLRTGHSAAVDEAVSEQICSEMAALRQRLVQIGAPPDIADRIARLFELGGAVGIAALGRKLGVDVIALSNAYTTLGQTLGLHWAQTAASRFAARDQWERLLISSLGRDFVQLRLDFFERRASRDPKAAVDQWVAAHGSRIEQFRRTVDRARSSAVTTIAMLGEIAIQARVLLGR